MTLLERIESANTLKEINALRGEVVEVHNSEILQAWQRKFWAMREKGEH